MVKKLIAVLMMLVLLTACGAETKSETVEDGLLDVKSKPYTIVISVPEDVTQETFGDAEQGCWYEAADGSYTITTEILDATTVEEGIEAISGIPADRLNVMELHHRPMPEYHFAWASAGEEQDTVSRCAMIASEDYYYVLTVNHRPGLGETQRKMVEQVFSSFCLAADETI